MCASPRARPGQVIRLAGQGKHGDLLLEIEYAAHPQFEVDGRNIIYTLPVAPWEAALGATVSVPTLGGRSEPTGSLRKAKANPPGSCCLLTSGRPSATNA